MDQKSFLIIGGTFKSGTSALFTYLAQVPGICASKVKETGFFIPAKYGESIADRKTYMDFFSEAKTGDHVFMEASPGYLYGGAPLISAVKDFIPETQKMIFLLRDPADRFISFYKMIRENNDVYMSKEVADREMTLQMYIDECRNYKGNVTFSDEPRDFLFNGLSDGYYAYHLETWFANYPEKDIKILFFEDLISDQKKVCEEILIWLNIDGSALDQIVFRPVNQSHHARSKLLRKLALKTNKRFQHFFRKNERVKRFMVKIYHVLNARKKKEKDVFTEERRLLEEIYAKDKAQLLQLLKSKGYHEFPSWLQST